MRTSIGWMALCAIGIACGQVQTTSPGAGPNAPDGGTTQGEGGQDGGTIDPGDGGGPSVVDTKCPALTMPAAAATVHVDATNTGAEDGSKSAPYKTLAQAFAGAAEGGVIFVAAG